MERCILGAVPIADLSEAIRIPALRIILYHRTLHNEIVDREHDVRWSIRNRDKAIVLPLEGDLPHAEAGANYHAAAAQLIAKFGPRGQILVTSLGSGDGKSTTAMNLVLAFLGKQIKVCLVELNLEHPILFQILGPSPVSYGVEDVLAGKTQPNDILCRREDNGLHFCMVNQPQSETRSRDLLKPGDHLDALLTYCGRHFDWTILDGPSLRGDVDGLELALRVELTLLVIRRGRRTMEALDEATKELDPLRLSILLND
jgi:Mrp family chromosome partitioning ATPase